MIKAGVLITVISLGLSGHAVAGFFKCKEADGTVRYTDQPCATGEEVKLPPLTTYTSAPVPTNFGKTADTADKQDLSEDAYKALTIVEPDNGAHIQAKGTGNVSIVVKAEPLLRAARGHVFAIVLDGKQLSATGVTNTIRLNNVASGTHSAQILILGKDRKLLQASNTVQFSVGRTNVSDGSRSAVPLVDANGDPVKDNNGNDILVQVPNAPKAPSVPRPGRATKLP